MSNSKLATVGPIISMEAIASEFATAKSIATAGGTVPQNAGEIWCYPSAACHWHPTGTPTSTYGHAVRASEPFMLRHSEQAAKVIGDAGAITLTVAYLRGAGRADGLGARTRPY